MVNAFDSGGGAGGFSTQEIAFLLDGKNVNFGPFYPPDRIQVSKQRNLKRKQGMCSGENVTDNGSKNREIHVSGELRKSELPAFNKILDTGEPFDLISDGFMGEVHIRKGDYEGPKKWDPRHKEWLYEYSLDLVSTGREEAENENDSGIINDGTGTSDSRDGPLGLQ